MGVSLTSSIQNQRQLFKSKHHTPSGSIFQGVLEFLQIFTKLVVLQSFTYSGRFCPPFAPSQGGTRTLPRLDERMHHIPSQSAPCKKSKKKRSVRRESNTGARNQPLRYLSWQRWPLRREETSVQYRGHALFNMGKNGNLDHN